MVSGAGFVEVICGYPGITPMLLEAVGAQDVYLIAGFTVITTVLLVIGNALGDILLAIVDPRIQMT